MSAVLKNNDQGKPWRQRGHLKSHLFSLTSAVAIVCATITQPATSDAGKSCRSIKPPSSAAHRPPIVIGHRGASYNLPEHTLEGYRLALELGADYIEPDLIPTKDGHLIAIHSFDLNVTTNVEKLFPGRARKHFQSNDPSLSGYFANDFTLAEIKTLKVKQRLEDTPARSPKMDYIFTIPTFVEILDLLHDWTNNVLPVIERSEIKQRQNTPGVYVELKNPSWIYNDTHGEVKVEDILLNTITKYPFAKELLFDPKSCNDDNEYSVPPLVLQCFEAETLEYLRARMEADQEMYQNVLPPSVYLLDVCPDSNFWDNLDSLNAIDAIGPNKNCLLDTDYGAAQKLMKEAKSRNLAVHPWTERLELEFVSEKFDDAEEELTYLFCEMKVDGIFAENVNLAKRVGAAGCEGESSPLLSSFQRIFPKEAFPFFVGGFIGGVLILLLLRLWSCYSQTRMRASNYQQIQTLPETFDQHQPV